MNGHANERTCKKQKSYSPCNTVWLLYRFGNIFNSEKKLNTCFLCTLTDDGFLTEMEHIFLSIPLNPFLNPLPFPHHIFNWFFWGQVISPADLSSSRFLHTFPPSLCSFHKQHLTKPIKIFWTLHCPTSDVQTPSQEYSRASELSTQSSCDTQHVPHSGTWDSEICWRRLIQLHYTQLTFQKGSVVAKIKNLGADRVRIIYTLSF